MPVPFFGKTTAALVKSFGATMRICRSGGDAASTFCRLRQIQAEEFNHE
jgi:hypothetical protein